MALSQTIFSIDIISVILLLATLVFLVKNREFERSEVENSMNALIFGIFFILLVMIVNSLVYLQKGYPNVLGGISNIDKYLGYLVTISDIALIPLFAVCFLVGIFLARDYLKEFPKLEKKEEKV